MLVFVSNKNLEYSEELFSLYSFYYYNSCVLLIIRIIIMINTLFQNNVDNGINTDTRLGRNDVTQIIKYGQ